MWKFDFNIISIKYLVVNSKKVSCIIRWTIPSTGEVRRTQVGASCSPDDKFSVDFGRKLAYNRCITEVFRLFNNKITDTIRDLKVKRNRYELKIKRKTNKLNDLIND